MVERRDGRSAQEMRPFKLTPDYILHPEGCVLVECGLTRVVCAASMEEKVPPFLRGQGTGWVTAEYGMLPRSTGTRMIREVSKGRASGRTLEIQRLIGRSLRSVVDLAALGERTIWVDCDVIQADGGTRTASITGAFVALALAIDQLLSRGALEQSPITDYLAAVSVGIVKGEPMLDLAYDEDSTAEVDMNVVMTGTGRFVEVQGTAEQEPFSRSRLDTLLDLAEKGIFELIELQRAMVAERLRDPDKILGSASLAVASGDSEPR